MDSQKVLTATLDDLVFEGRNKSYGAYFLRQKYSRHLLIALLIGMGVYIFGFTAPLVLSMLNSSTNQNNKKKITLTELSEAPPIDKNVPPPPPPDLPPPPKKTVKFTPPVIKADDEVKPEDIPPPQEELQKVDPGPVTEIDPNANYDFNAQVPDVVEEKKPDYFVYVEQMPEFPGGTAALMQYLSSKIKYPPAARENGIEGKVVVEFIVDEKGTISNIKVKRDIGGGCGDEAVRVIKSMPPWKPGKQNGNPVKVLFNLPVSFSLNSSE